ncbi:YhcN/YlaJ family sporulation lipoprotein [Metabacillus sp. GX 13764]|uniref:YhcN/YlaJ family sporulation lipoprotein n=1 Tax=Metabacillus kandeliae TaxID=2900151 RepID=UPI001E3BEB91|nr:YhcN/YlaJ family sporulation lipoprotein [Metabacillus kandeliae]MCD7033941.1 YhcN/YlaJ family sporulation lipoprotein [Metabacillus kandeliae]
MFRFPSFLLIAGLLLLPGCTNNDRSLGESSGESRNKPITVKNTVREPADKQTGQAASERLSSLASDVPGVKNASAVVLGKYAVVGINVDGKLERSKVQSIKYAVAESLKNDPYGANAAVIADPDTTDRLKEIGKQIQKGRPVIGILDELAAIAGRVVPDVPSDTLDNPDQQPTQSDKDQLPAKEQKDLDKQQEKQSNQELKR